MLKHCFSFCTALNRMRTLPACVNIAPRFINVAQIHNLKRNKSALDSDEECPASQK